MRHFLGSLKPVTLLCRRILVVCDTELEQGLRLCTLNRELLRINLECAEVLSFTFYDLAR